MTVNPLLSNDDREKFLAVVQTSRSFFIFTLFADVIFLVAAMIFNWGYFFTGTIAGAIMVPYCLTASRLAEKTGAHHQLGDSCYFLGFLLTLIGLAISLYDLGQDVEGKLAATAVVARFGAAIITTLVGMIARIIITQFSLISVGSPEQVRRGQRYVQSCKRIRC